MENDCCAFLIFLCSTEMGTPLKGTLSVSLELTVQEQIILHPNCLLKAPERWRKASADIRQDKRSRYPVVQQNTESYACGHGGDGDAAGPGGQSET